MLRLAYQPPDDVERSVAFDNLVVRFGTDAQCDLCLRGSADAPVQGRHGEFISLGETYALVGHNERCQLWVDGRSVHRLNLKGGEQIRVGSPSGPKIRVLSVGREAQSVIPGAAPAQVAPAQVAPVPLSSARVPVAPAPVVATPVAPGRRRAPAPSALSLPAPSDHPADVQHWLGRAAEKMRRARSAKGGMSSGQTLFIMEEALSGLRATEEGRVRKGRRALWLVGVISLAAVVSLGVVIWYQHQRIQELVRAKAAIDRQIQSVSEAMDKETDSQRLAEMEGHLQVLVGSAQEKVAEVSASNPERGTALQKPADELEAQLRRLLKSFNAETYVVPPNFKSMLATVVAELAASPTLRTDFFRRQRYWGQIQTALERSQLPKELGYVAFTESRFDPYARNPRSGAAGMWQLMPNTARECGITVSPSKDERLDPVKSSHAATCYLSRLLIEFGEESFMLVLASYNRGENGVRHALHLVAREPGGYKKRDFWHLYRMKLLPPETREYVPRVLAAALIFENPGKYGLESD
jgi:membrane-bound lytic murein transglycosylase D